MKDFNELQVFTFVVGEMSFTKAAAALEISKAAVSKTIANLERRLATRLFERTTRRVRLTEAGETYWNYARRAVEEAEAAETAVLQLSEQPRGTLRVAMPVTMAQSSLAPNLQRFLAAFPELRLEITLRGGQIDPIAQRVDMVFQTTRPAVDSQLIQKRLRSISLGLYASPPYLKNAPPLRSPQDLLRHSCITLQSAREGTIWKLEREGKVQELRLRARIAIGDPVVHHRLCADGAGIAVLPNWLVRRHARESPLTRVLPDWQPDPIELYLIYPTRLSLTPKLTAFLSFVESILPDESKRPGARSPVSNRAPLRNS